MTHFKLADDVLDAPIEGSASLAGAATLRDALGSAPTIVSFVRHFG